jgi:flagellar protein FlgJ
MSTVGGGGSGLPLQKFQQLRRLPTPQEQDQKLREVGELYEKQFLREMVKQMRGTIGSGGMLPINQAESIFTEQLDQEYVEKWGGQGGIGLSDMIYQQLIERYGPALGIKTPAAKPQGPLPMDEKSKFRGFIQQGAVGPQSPNDLQKYTVEFQRKQGEEGTEDVKSPWSGVLRTTERFGEGFAKVGIEHSNGLTSQFVYRGEPMSNLNGQEIQAGQRVGVMAPESKTLTWSLNLGPKSEVE